jgi:hypothetical protein
MIVSPSRIKTVKVRKKLISYSDSTPKNTFNKFISIIKMRWFGLYSKFEYNFEIPEF